MALDRSNRVPVAGPDRGVRAMELGIQAVAPMGEGRGILSYLQSDIRKH